MRNIIIHTDGASRGNPGPAAIAYTIEGLDEKIEYAQIIGDTTNNQAEYQALVAALEKLTSLNQEKAVVTCYADSELMVKQLNGVYRVKDMALKPHFDRIKASALEIKALSGVVEYVYVRREENSRADELGNMALDGKVF